MSDPECVSNMCRGDQLTKMGPIDLEGGGGEQFTGMKPIEIVKFSQNCENQSSMYNSVN